jgi:hypothetical protein
VSKGSHAFKESDVARAIRAAQKAGLNVSKFRISKQGEIEVEAGPPTAADTPEEWTVK